MGLFKTREEKAEINFNKGADLISQGKFEDALYYFQKSIENGNNTPEVFVTASLLRLSRSYKDPRNLKAAIEELSNYPGVTVKFGVHDVDSSRIIDECRLKAELADLNRRDSMGEADKELGNAMIECGKHYIMAYSDETLVMEDIFSNVKMTGRECALTPLARGFEILSNNIKWEDPRKAAEYLQKAAQYHTENNNAGRANEDSRLQENYSITAHCWFCGKKIIGKGIHFVAMPVDITKPIVDQCNSDTMDLMDNGPSEIYVCRACFSAMDNLGKHYLEQSKVYTNQVADELQAEINSLQAQISSLRFSR